MRLSLISYLLLGSALFLLRGCSPAYKAMPASGGEVSNLQKFKWGFQVALYRATVDVVGNNHLSGLLIIKKMPDSSTRVVFSNEMGFTFFDFGFGTNGAFKVYSIIKKMNRKPVIKTLQKDFELVFMEGLDRAPVSIHRKDGLLYYVFPKTRGYNSYITDSTGNTLVRMERSSKRKTVVMAIMQNYRNGIPDTIGISHKTFLFNIGLKRLQR